MINVHVTNAVPQQIKDLINKIKTAGDNGFNVIDKPTFFLNRGVQATLLGLDVSDKFKDDNGNPKIKQILLRSDNGDPAVSATMGLVIDRLSAFYEDALRYADDLARRSDQDDEDDSSDYDDWADADDDSDDVSNEDLQVIRDQVNDIAARLDAYLEND